MSCDDGEMGLGEEMGGMRGVKHYLQRCAIQGTPTTLTEIKGISWKEFYNKYKADGGDGFYGNVAIPYLEPALINKKIGKVILDKGLCPIAEELQQKVMAFKTNYRDVNTCINQANILKNLINKIGRK